MGGALILDRCRAFDLFASVDAHLCLPGRGTDVKYHVDGKLDIANREEIKHMVHPAAQGWRQVHEDDSHPLRADIDTSLYPKVDD